MTKFTHWFFHARMVLLVAWTWILLDQLSKEFIRQTIPLHHAKTPIPALGDYFVFEHVNNYGAAFGILQNQGNFFAVIALIVSAAILTYVRYIPTDQRLIRLFLGLQLGGALGNLIDRLMQGYVTDFIKMGIPGTYYWPNYNIADAGIVTGVIGLGVYIFFEDLRLQRAARAQSQLRQPMQDLA